MAMLADLFVLMAALHLVYADSENLYTPDADEEYELQTIPAFNSIVKVTLSKDKTHVDITCASGYFHNPIIDPIYPTYHIKSVTYDKCLPPNESYASTLTTCGVNVKRIENLTLQDIPQEPVLLARHLDSLPGVTTLNVFPKTEDQPFRSDMVFLRPLQNLEWLNVRNMVLPPLPEGFPVKIVQLTMGWSEGEWGGCSQLLWLTIEQWYVPALAQPGTAGWLAHCPNLVSLKLVSLKAKTIKRILIGASHLEELLIFDSMMRELTRDMLSSKDLIVLKIINCGLLHIAGDAFSWPLQRSLQQLDFSSNDLNGASVSALQPLQELRGLILSDNPHLDFCDHFNINNDNSKMVTLRLSHTGLSRLCFGDFHALIILDLSENNITTLQFDDLPVAKKRERTLEVDLRNSNVTNVVFSQPLYQNLVQLSRKSSSKRTAPAHLFASIILPQTTHICAGNQAWLRRAITEELIDVKHLRCAAETYKPSHATTPGPTPSDENQLPEHGEVQVDSDDSSDGNLPTNGETSSDPADGNYGGNHEIQSTTSKEEEEHYDNVDYHVNVPEGTDNRDNDDDMIITQETEMNHLNDAELVDNHTIAVSYIGETNVKPTLEKETHIFKGPHGDNKHLNIPGDKDRTVMDTNDKFAVENDSNSDHNVNNHFKIPDGSDSHINDTSDKPIPKNIINLSNDTRNVKNYLNIPDFNVNYNYHSGTSVKPTLKEDDNSNSDQNIDDQYSNGAHDANNHYSNVSHDVNNYLDIPNFNNNQLSNTSVKSTSDNDNQDNDDDKRIADHTIAVSNDSYFSETNDKPTLEKKSNNVNDAHNVNNQFSNGAHNVKNYSNDRHDVNNNYSSGAHNYSKGTHDVSDHLKISDNNDDLINGAPTPVNETIHSNVNNLYSKGTHDVNNHLKIPDDTVNHIRGINVKPTLDKSNNSNSLIPKKVIKWKNTVWNKIKEMWKTTKSFFGTLE